MNISVCLPAVFDSDILKGLEEINTLGIKDFEFWGWWDKDIEAIKAIAEKNKQRTVALCTRFISLVDPQCRMQYLEGLRETIEVAKSLNCKTIISQVGDDTGADRAFQHKSLVEGLRQAADILKGTKITLVIEPLNDKKNHQGYYLTSSKEAYEIIDEVGSDNIKVLFDIYHQQITEGDILTNLLPNIDKIGHMHCAGSDGRHELNYGELNYAYIAQKIDAAGYNGFIGLEYFPVNDAKESIISAVKLLKNKK